MSPISLKRGRRSRCRGDGDDLVPSFTGFGRGRRVCGGGRLTGLFFSFIACCACVVVKKNVREWWDNWCTAMFASSSIWGSGWGRCNEFLLSFLPSLPMLSLCILLCYCWFAGQNWSTHWLTARYAQPLILRLRVRILTHIFSWLRTFPNNQLLTTNRGSICNHANPICLSAFVQLTTNTMELPLPEP